LEATQVYSMVRHDPYTTLSNVVKVKFLKTTLLKKRVNLQLVRHCGTLRAYFTDAILPVAGDSPASYHNS